MTDLNQDKLREMAGKIRNLLEEFEMNVQGFTLQIDVPGEYYQTIKENFPDRPPMDLILGIIERGWAIHLHHSLTFGLKQQN